MITEYTSGSLPLAQSACVSMHVNQCKHCQRIANQLADVGASLFEALEPVAVSENQLDSVLARLDEEQPLGYAKPAEKVGGTPAVLQRLMRGDFSDLSWKNIAPPCASVT